VIVHVSSSTSERSQSPESATKELAKFVITHNELVTTHR
jgi:hypothetical protein